MAEKSLLWQTNTAGDGSSEYTQAEVIQWQREKHIDDTTAEGIYGHVGVALEVSGTATPVNVGTGAACVYGFHYWNTSNISTAIPTPGTGTRIDRLVLQADWTNRQVRLTRLPGVTFGGGATAVALTQTDGVTWEIPLAQLSITTGGAITVTDEREVIRPKVYRRQGGSATDWSSTGTTNYLPVTAQEQVGAMQGVYSGGASGAWSAQSYTINFPVAFSHTPAIFISPIAPNWPSGVNGYAYLSDYATDHFDLGIATYDYTGGSFGSTYFWRAVGPID